MKIITESMVEQHLDMPDCIDAMREAMITVSKGDALLPIRQFMPVKGADGKMAIMPGSMTDPACFGIKLVCKYVREPDSPYGTHVGMVLVFDSDKGLPLAMIEGSSLTAIRTAAASALATKYLAPQTTNTLLIMGCGEQARRHIEAMLAVRAPKEILVWGRSYAKAQEFAAATRQKLGVEITAIQCAETAVKHADLICTTTSSVEPILKGEWLKPGTHVNLVGAAIPTSAEVDTTAVARAEFFVDYRPAAMAAAGELLNAIEAESVGESHIRAEIGEVAAGIKTGRTSDDAITIYKSLGVAAQDLAAGNALYRKALTLGFGQDIEMMDYSE